MPRRIETYEQAIEFLFNRINYERLTSESYGNNNFKLDRMRRLLERIGHPEQRLPVIHVAGTKGKGSTSAMLAATLTAAGYRCGLYTSPHLVAFEERFTVGGQSPSPSELVALVNRLLPIVEELDHEPGRWQPTYFELATALAWLFFEEQKCDLAVLEVGLGGRLDSTNLCSPLVTVITNVSRDHTQVLGNTVGEISWEKAGIIKPGIPLVTGARHPDAIAVIERVAHEHAAATWWLDREITCVGSPSGESRAPRRVWEIRTPAGTRSQLTIALPGEHQGANAALAVGVIDRLREQGWTIPEEAIAQGLAQVVWPARIEVIARQPTVIVDAAHNWESAKALVQTLGSEFPARRRRLVFAATKDKDVAGLLRQLLPNFETVILTRYVDNPRGMPVEELAQIAGALTDRPMHVIAEPAAAWKAARRLAQPDDVIVVTGSFFLISELRDQITDDCVSGALGAARPSVAAP